MIYKLKPILKQRLWGGKFLPKIYGQNTNEKIGEAWILSCLGNDNCFVNKTETLLDLFKANPNIVAKGYSGSFPLLVKLIDAQDDLSIQVHPNIKTEFWHILNKKPSKLYMGFKQNTTKAQVQKSLMDSKVTTLLNHVDVVNGDSYLINPGTIHAIGKKTFLIEIQQSADITYRLYDFNRVDVNGKPRQLHIKEALKCINYSQLSVAKKQTTEQLVACPYFHVYKYGLKDSLEFNADNNSFQSIVILDGKGSIKSNKQKLAFKPYDTFFIPAGSGQYKLTGKGTIIRITL